jgi:hypothetical protein
MGCVTSTNFAVLTNGRPTNLFNISIELRQGCPLSPLLFILIMEGLSRSLLERVGSNNIVGIPIARGLRIMHLMFVDDVVMFGICCKTE